MMIMPGRGTIVELLKRESFTFWNESVSKFEFEFIILTIAQHLLDKLLLLFLQKGKDLASHPCI